MSIVSDALKKVEGNSAVTPAGADDSTPTSAPPLFSVWSVLLSTIMVLIAAVLLLATWYTNRSRVAASPPALVENEVAPAPPSSAVLPVTPDAPPAVVRDSKPEPGSAPVDPSAVAAAPAPSVEERRDELELTGVVYTSRLRMAHINGKVISEGAEIAGYKVIRISRDSVRLSKDGKFFILKPKH
jgi:general secretion pathway protein B